jgi:hypothetical protein
MTRLRSSLHVSRLATVVARVLPALALLAMARGGPKFF